MREGLLEYAEALAKRLIERDPVKPYKRKEFEEIFQALVEGGVCTPEEIEDVTQVLLDQRRLHFSRRGQTK